MNGEAKELVLNSFSSKTPSTFRITLPELLMDEVSEDEEHKQGEASSAEEDSI